MVLSSVSEASPTLFKVIAVNFVNKHLELGVN